MRTPHWPPASSKAVQQIGGALGLATHATLAIRHADDAVQTGMSPGEAFAEGISLGYQVGVVLLLIGAVPVMLLLEHVVAVPRNPLVEELAAKTDDTPELV